MSSLRKLLVVGATGQQGGALIAALLQQPTQHFEIFALTRSKTSSKAQSLAKHSNVRVIEGNLDAIDAVFKQVPAPLWGVFAVPILDKGVEKEEKQIAALVEASLAAGVEHFVLTTTDRGGPVKSENEPTPVPHFASKFKCEQLIKKKAAASNGKFTYTFLRPAAFYDNFNPGFFGSAHTTMWSMNGPDNKLQMVGTKDVGRIGAEAFLHAGEPEYRNTGISIAGDSLTPAEVARIFQEEMGKPVPRAFYPVGLAVRYLIADLRAMYGWFKHEGFAADINGLKTKYPFLQDFRTWLREDSGWRKT